MSCDYGVDYIRLYSWCHSSYELLEMIKPYVLANKLRVIYLPLTSDVDGYGLEVIFLNGGT